MKKYHLRQIGFGVGFVIGLVVVFYLNTKSENAVWISSSGRSMPLVVGIPFLTGALGMLLVKKLS